MFHAQTFAAYTQNLFVVECFFLGLIILAVRQRGEPSTLILGVTFLVAVVRSLTNGVLDEAILAQYPRLRYLPQFRAYEIPVFYLYTRYLLQLPTGRRQWLVLLPSALLGACYSVAFVLGIEQVPFLKTMLNREKTILELSLGGYELLLFAMIFRLIRQQEQELRQHLSDLRAVQLNWLKAFFAAVFLISFYENARYFLRYFWQIEVEKNVWISIGFLLIYSGFFFIITYYGLKYPLILRGALPPIVPSVAEPTSNETTKLRYEKSKLADAKLLDLYTQVTAYLESADEPYRQTDFRLSSMAGKLGHPTAYLSQAIGQCGPHGNFYNLVNHYRVEAVKRRLQQPASDRLTLLGVAQECGFTNNQTFGKAFKQFTGLTPSQYRSEYKNAAETLPNASTLIRPDANGVA